MDFHHVTFAASEHEEKATPIRAIGSDVFSTWLETAPPVQSAWVVANRFEAARGEWITVPGEDGRVALVLFGLGTGGLEGLDSRLFGALPQALPHGFYKLTGLASVEEYERAALGWMLGAYQFTKYRMQGSLPAHLMAPEGVDVARVERLVAGMTLARNMINTPTEEMGPADLEIVVRDVADVYGGAVKVAVGQALLDQNFPLIHAVGRAASQEPRLIEMRWEGPEAAHSITLVGKGVCFDTGGLDIKPSSGMLIMKKDMGGAACTLALAQMIMDANLPVKLRLLIPAVENSISANSFRPGDVFKSRKGITVENRNTDAEGRLVLADALTEAANENPDLIVDMATLTGAARVALGADVPPFFCANDALAADIAAAGEQMGDPVWRLPLYAGYERDLRSSIADITNAPAGGMAGAITAALFLQRFVEPESLWVHFDIYGWCQRGRPGRPEGAECHAAMAMYKVIEDRCANKT